MIRSIFNLFIILLALKVNTNTQNIKSEKYLKELNSLLIFNIYLINQKITNFLRLS